MTARPSLAAPLRIALVGCGHVSQYHLAAWQRVSEARVEAVADVVEERARRRAREHGIPQVFADYAAMLDAVRPDAVDICVGPALHLAFVREAAARGIHISCQKPMAETLEDAREMIRVSEAAGVRLFIHENWRWRSWFREIRKVLEAGTLGAAHYCHYSARMPGTVPIPEYPGSFSLGRQPFFAAMKRFLLFESGIHMLDVCRFLFGEPRSIYAQTRHISPLIQAEDLVTAVLNFGPTLVVCERSYAALGRALPSVTNEEMVIEGDRGAVFLGAGGTVRVVEEDAGRRSAREIPPPEGDAYLDSYRRTVEHFSRALLAGAPFETGARDNIRTLELMLKGYESAAENRVVEIA